MKRIVLLGFLLLPLMAQGISLRIDGERAWLSSDGASLSSVLSQFEACGVEVLLDPSLEMNNVEGSWENAKVERVISQMVSPNSYLLEWTVERGPLGRIEKLSSIHIFSSGKSSAAKPLSKGRVLDVFENQAGLKYVRGEILVAFREGSTEADLNALLTKLKGTLIEVIDPPGLYRIRIGEGMSVEEAMAIAASMLAVEATEPNLVFDRVENEQQVEAGSGGSVDRNIKPGDALVAVLDSGLDPAYADAAFVKGTYNALNPADPISDPTGHGTLTTLIAAGAVVPEGAAPAAEGVSVLSVQVFDENGVTSADTLMRAIDYVSDAGAEIVTMSWGTEVNSDFIETTMDYAADEGMVLFASAGNEPTGVEMYPAAYDSVVGVGGLDPDGTVWENSNYGDFVEVYEPAVAVMGSQTYAGTSVASPYAANQLALTAPPE
ncbi:MAG: S8 family serine peptidase [Pontiellaceae bacterium]|nr:S8 family serine peptidase [Pontiellaceae bacterium]